MIGEPVGPVILPQPQLQVRSKKPGICTRCLCNSFFCCGYSVILNLFVFACLFPVLLPFFVEDFHKEALKLRLPEKGQAIFEAFGGDDILVAPFLLEGDTMSISVQVFETTRGLTLATLSSAETQQNAFDTLKAHILFPRKQTSPIELYSETREDFRSFALEPPRSVTKTIDLSGCAQNCSIVAKVTVLYSHAKTNFSGDSQRKFVFTTPLSRTASDTRVRAEDLFSPLEQLIQTFISFQPENSTDFPSFENNELEENSELVDDHGQKLEPSEDLASSTYDQLINAIHFKRTLTLSPVIDQQVLRADEVPRQMNQYFKPVNTPPVSTSEKTRVLKKILKSKKDLYIDDVELYRPIVYVNDPLDVIDDDYVTLNAENSHSIDFTLSINPLTLSEFAALTLLSEIDSIVESKIEKFGEDSRQSESTSLETNNFKNDIFNFLEKSGNLFVRFAKESLASLQYENLTNIYIRHVLVGLTFGSAFLILAINNDLRFWAYNFDFDGVSLVAVLINFCLSLYSVYSYFTFLFSFGSFEDDVITAGVSLHAASFFLGVMSVPAWKLSKALRFDERTIIGLNYSDQTCAIDFQGLKYLTYIVVPLVATLAAQYVDNIYFISDLMNMEIAENIARLTVFLQIYLNYKRQSVAGAPMRALIYSELSSICSQDYRYSFFLVVLIYQALRYRNK